MSELPKAEEVRTPDHPIAPIFLRRWSPRAMSGEALEDAEIQQLFEAGRWAPSVFNEQEWRFLYARRETPHWDEFLGLLAEGNRGWCANAGLLGCVVSHRFFDRNGKPNRVHQFDAGMAYMNLALQGSELGLVVHAMMGFDADRARTTLEVPEDHSVDVMFAVGRPGDPAALPEGLRDREVPSDRKPIAETVREGRFRF